MWQQSGFLQSDADVQLAMKKLAVLIDDVVLHYKTLSEEVLMHRISPGKWSVKEILGHLIDSAVNNLKRFTEIQFLPQPYLVTAYQQNELVVVNNYQDIPVMHLLHLWTALNQQVIYVVNNISGEKLSYPVNPQYDNGEMKSLAWIICDYVAHIEHHFKRVL
ncbi:MAG: DinB family protein [Bacteroidota bacterium]